jgi:hypothetical protein
MKQDSHDQKKEEKEEKKRKELCISGNWDGKSESEKVWICFYSMIGTYAAGFLKTIYHRHSSKFECKLLSISSYLRPLLDLSV